MSHHLPTMPRPMTMEIPSIPELHWPHFVHHWHWVLGAFIAILAAFISNIGLNLQKLAHIEIAYGDPFTKKERPLSARENYLFNHRWISGIALTILGSVADFAALAFAAQSLVAILGSLTLVCNILLAPLMLNEKVTRLDVRAVIMIVTGCTIAVSFGQHRSEVHTLDRLLYMFGTTAMILYIICTLMVIGAFYGGIYYIENKYKCNDAATQYMYKKESSASKLHRFLYPAVSGVVGAQSVLFGKCTAEILKGSLVSHHHSSNSTLTAASVFAHPMTWFILLMMLSCILIQIRSLNRGLQLFDALYVVPIFQTFWILVSVLGGLVFFDEWEHFSALQAIFFPIGILLTVRGVVELSRRSGDTSLGRRHSGSRRGDDLNADDDEHNIRHVESGHGVLTVNGSSTAPQKRANGTSKDDAEDEDEIEDDDSRPLLG